MRTDRIYIARDGKSGMHVLVRILAVGDIGADYLPIDPDGFNELMMARDARSLVLAAQGLGPMLASEGDLASRIFVPSELRRGIAGEMDLVPSDLGGLLSECYFDPYAEPVGTGGMGYRGIGRTGKKAARDLIEGFDFSNAGDLSYLDSQFRAVVEQVHDVIVAVDLEAVGKGRAVIRVDIGHVGTYSETVVPIDATRREPARKRPFPNGKGRPSTTAPRVSFCKRPVSSERT